MSRAIYPGSFDPFTYGHFDILKRGLKFFDHITIAITDNPTKKHIFTREERVQMIKEVVKPLKAVDVDQFDGLLVDYAKKRGVYVILRGIRTMSDFEYEYQMALTNRAFLPQLETVFIMTGEEFSYIRSRLIKEAASLGGDISKFVPPQIAKKLIEKFKSS